MEGWQVGAIWIGAVSLLSLGATVVDKIKARGGGRRIPERVLLGLALAGGSPGLAVGMVLARHKTRKASFLARFFGVLLVQAAVVWFLMAQGYV